MSTHPAPQVPLDDVIVPPEPARGESNPRVEKDALLDLSQTLARKPQAAVQRLVEVALKLTAADSAGVSLEDQEAGQAVFRWVAVAGEFTRYLGGTMPRHFSPCGAVLARGRTLVMREPARHYPYIGQLHVPIHGALLSPFGRQGRPVGTVWVLSHRPTRRFSADDVRLVENLTTFATAVLDAAQPDRGQGPAGPA
jgi:GAF domain-containing protein